MILMYILVTPSAPLSLRARISSSFILVTSASYVQLHHRSFHACESHFYFSSPPKSNNSHKSSLSRTFFFALPSFLLQRCNNRDSKRLTRDIKQRGIDFAYTKDKRLAAEKSCFFSFFFGQLLLRCVFVSSYFLSCRSFITPCTDGLGVFNIQRRGNCGGLGLWILVDR